MPRKYAGPLRPRERSAKVPKALQRVRHKPSKPNLKLSATTKKLVSAEINKKEETNEKFYQSSLVGLPNIPDQSSFLFRLLPDLHQSGQPAGGGTVYPVNRETRTGTKVRLMAHRVTGRIFIPWGDGVDSVDRSVISCRLLILSCKRFQKYGDITDNWATGADLRNSMLRNGASQDGFDGYQFGLDLPVNDEIFTTHYDKKFVLNRGHIQTFTSAGSSSGLGAAHMPAALKYFSCNLKVKSKILKFADEANALPANYAPFCLLCYSYTNDAAPSATRVCSMQTNSKLRWKNM